MWKIRNQKFHQTDWEKIYSLSPSGYIRKGALQVFERIRQNFPDDHILCIGYAWGDTQFAITETFKTYETKVEEVVDRCLVEELSMERVEKTDCTSFIFHEKFATIHCVPFRIEKDNLRSISVKSHIEEMDKDDDKKRKLVLLLHGSFSVIHKLLSQFASDEKEITHLISIPVKNIANVFPRFFSSYGLLQIPTRQALFHQNPSIQKCLSI